MTGNSKPWLVVGGTGQLGSAVCLYLKSIGNEVISLSSGTGYASEVGIKSKIIDFRNEAESRKRLESISPAAVVNCMAVTDVDSYGSEKIIRDINVRAPATLAHFACERGIPFVHISTDSLYRLDKGVDRAVESSPIEPVNPYAQSKLAGELAVIQSYDRAAVLRTNFFGWNPVTGKGLAEWMVGKFEREEAFVGFSDVKFSPLYTETLAQLTVAAARIRLSGVFNVGGATCVSKYLFGVMIAERLGLSTSLIRSGSIDEIALKARRPRNTCLDSAIFFDSLGLKPHTLESEIEKFATSPLRFQLKNFIRQLA